MINLQKTEAQRTMYEDWCKRQVRIKRKVTIRHKQPQED